MVTGRPLGYMAKVFAQFPDRCPPTTDWAFATWEEFVLTEIAVMGQLDRGAYILPRFADGRWARVPTTLDTRLR
jgi:hypothetical protein